MKQDVNFNDSQLISLARRAYYQTSLEDSEKYVKVEELLTKNDLTNKERNLLIEFVNVAQPTKTLSIRQMKEEIFNMIGADKKDIVNYQYGATVSRKELEIIYTYIRKLV